jgi:hypothetical protein
VTWPASTEIGIRRARSCREGAHHLAAQRLVVEPTFAGDDELGGGDIVGQPGVLIADRPARRIPRPPSHSPAVRGQRGLHRRRATQQRQPAGLRAFDVGGPGVNASSGRPRRQPSAIAWAASTAVRLSP